MREPSSIHEYESVRDRIKTGDVIAFSGRLCISHLNQWVTQSPYSHVAMVLEVEMGGGFGKSVLIIESAAPQTERDPIGRKAIKGVQINWLSRRLDMYKGKAWWLPLQEPIAPDQLLKMQMWLRQTYNERRPFDTLQAAKAGVILLNRLGLGNKLDLSALFCSELVTAALQIADVVDPYINPSKQTPADVVNFPCFSHPPILIKPFPSRCKPQ
ncbi:MAG: hypothetical protein RLP97_13155 [Coleofasciculus chthonoplastes F2-STO-03]